MPDPSPDGPRPGGWAPPPADPTRDIRLPPLPDRPAPAVRPEWLSHVPAPQESPSGPAAQPAAEPPREAPGPPRRSSHDLPTDRLAARQDQARSTTLAFQPPPPVQLLKVSVGARRTRGRWLWALAILLPLLIIIGSGVWLFVVFYGG